MLAVYLKRLPINCTPATSVQVSALQYSGVSPGLVLRQKQCVIEGAPLGPRAAGRPRAPTCTDVALTRIITTNSESFHSMHLYALQSPSAPQALGPSRAQNYEPVVPVRPPVSQIIRSLAPATAAQADSEQFRGLFVAYRCLPIVLQFWRSWI